MFSTLSEIPVDLKPLLSSREGSNLTQEGDPSSVKTLQTRQVPACPVLQALKPSHIGGREMLIYEAFGPGDAVTRSATGRCWSSILCSYR